MVSTNSLQVLSHHRKLLCNAGISDEVISARGYRTISRPTPGDDRPRQELKRLSISGKVTRRDTSFPGILIPLYRATGEQISVQYRPDSPPKDPETGKLRKYVMPTGRPAVLDVHPFNRDRITDPTVPLWITEGVKKGDALTTAGACVVTLSGVYNWRSTLATLGDWEDVPLRGRKVFVCFDADAATNPNVAKAMRRLGEWLKSKGAEPAYIVVPGDPEDKAGADDFLAAGGAIDDLIAAATTRPPDVATPSDSLTDAVAARDLADDLDGSYCWAQGLGWLRWDGRRWAMTPDQEVRERARQWVLARYRDACDTARESHSAAATARIQAWHKYQSLARLNAIVALAEGILRRDAEDFDAHPDLLNCANGVVDLRTGELLSHDPGLLMTKFAPVPYDPGAEHPDWKSALEAVPADILDWYQVRLGQAITGHMTPDDVMLVQVGTGENGKTTLMSAIQRAVGDYFHNVPHRALLADASAHPTELADFRGVRLAVLEETPEERRLSVTRLKLLVGTPQITARHIRQDSVTFNATHTLIINTNYTPSVAETDHGTWRRLALVRFPYRWLKPGVELRSDLDRPGDPGLRERLRNGLDGQHEAVLKWLVGGAVRWYQADRVMPPIPKRVERDTRAWRAESDLVLAFWDERLVTDPDSNIAATDMLGEFNEWLRQRGHREWSDKTLGARLAGHDVTVSNSVEQGRTRDRKAASRPTGAFVRLPERYRTWFGVRFRDGDDDDE